MHQYYCRLGTSTAVYCCLSLTGYGTVVRYGGTVVRYGGTVVRYGGTVVRLRWYGGRVWWYDGAVWWCNMVVQCGSAVARHCCAVVIPVVQFGSSIKMYQKVLKHKLIK